MKNTKDLTHNPLGIIALFISLIYGCACLVVVNGLNGISEKLHWVLIWFLVIFPFAILIAFVYLVINHHGKLYAPQDYKKDESFLIGMGIESQHHKILSDIGEIDNLTALSVDEDIEAKEEEDNYKANDENRVDIKTNVEEYREIETENNIADQSNKYENIYRSDFSSVRNDYLKIEELVLQKIENEYKKNIDRYVYVNTPLNKRLGVDGTFTKNNTIYLLEVKYFKTNTISFSSIQSIQRMIEALSLVESHKVKLIIAIVHKSGLGEKMRNHVYSVFEKGNHLYQFKFYSEERLQSRK